MAPGDIPYRAFHRAVDRDRPACAPRSSGRTAIGLVLALLLIGGILA